MPARKVKKVKRIKVLVGELVKPLVTRECDAGTPLIKFLEDNGIQWGSSVRVNAEAESKEYKLKDGDVITTIGSVSGGR